MTEKHEQPAPVVALIGMLTGGFLPRAIQVAARLGLGHILRKGSANVAELARKTGSDPIALAKVLRLLAENDIVLELEDGSFGPTPLSDQLHLVDHPLFGEEDWQAWGGLMDAVRTGKPAFESVHGASVYQTIVRDPAREANWNEWNTVTAASWLPSLIDALHLSGTERVVDVGGGQGTLLVEILNRFPGCQGILLDLASVVVSAPAILQQHGVSGRCKVTAGDAFVSVPPGGDAYTLCRILFNWDRKKRVQLLRNCRAAMRPGSRLCVVEMVMPEKGDPMRKRLAGIDLDIWLTWGSNIPTLSEWESLFTDSGFSLVRVSEPPTTALPWRVLEGSPK